MRRFARVELGDDEIPDESPILHFRHLVEKHGLTATDAVAADIEQLPELIHGEESVAYGDQTYWRKKGPARLREGRPPLPDEPARRGRQRALERPVAQDRPSPFAHAGVLRAAVPRGEAAVGLPEDEVPRAREENLARAQAMFALANLYEVRHGLMPPGVGCAL